MSASPSRGASPSALDKRATGHGRAVLKLFTHRMIEFSIAVVFAVFIALASAAPNASLGLSKFAIVAGRVALIGAIIRVLRLWKGRVGYRLTETFLTAISFVASGHFVMRSPLPFFVNATVWGAIVIAGIVRF